KSRPAIELAVLEAECGPVLGGQRETVPHPLSLEVVLQPVAQPRPGAYDGLVSELDHAVVAGHQPRADHQVDETVLLLCHDHLVTRYPATDRLAFGPRHDQPEHELAQQRALVLADLPVQLFGRLRNRATDAARRLVPADGQGAALVPEPCLSE